MNTAMRNNVIWLCVWTSLLASALNVSNLSAAILSDDRSGKWQGNVGVPGGIPNRTTIFVNVKTTSDPRYHCYGDGTHDDSTAIMNAIYDCPFFQVIYVPQGTYFIGSQVRIYSKSYWTLRGDGPGKTIFTGGSPALFSIGNSPWLSTWPQPTAITSGATNGSSAIVVASAANIVSNQLMWLEQANDGVSTFGYGIGSGTIVANLDDRMHDNTHIVNTRVLVTNITGNVVKFTPPLAFDFNPALSPSAVGFGGLVGPQLSGLEDITVKGSASGDGVSVSGSYGFWLKNVELTAWRYFGFEFAWSTCCEIRHCYIHEPAAYDVSTGYALQFDGANNCLVEDNILWKNESGIILQGGSVANVFGYNFLFQVYNIYGGLQNHAENLYGNHTPYPLLNLWEGNCGSGFQLDFYYGPSSRTTLLRNYLTCADPDVTQARVAVSIDSHQWSNSVIGNVLGSSGTHAPFRAVLPNVNFSWSNTAPQNFTYDSGLRNFAYTENVVFRLGYPFSGNNGAAGATADGTTNHLNYIDLLVRSNTVIHGNWDYSSKSIKYDPTIADHAVPASYYLTGKPTWFGSLQWPPFDPGNPSLCDLTNLPAGYRFIFGVDPPAGVLNKKPVAVMNAAPPKGTAPLTVSFSSAGSFDPEGVMLTYLWVFGDGSTSTVPNPTHTFLSSSNYLIRLIISDGTNTTTASNLTINVSMLDPKKSAETELKQVVRRTMLERDGFLANNECPSDTIAEPSAVFSRSFAASRLRRRNAWG